MPRRKKTRTTFTEAPPFPLEDDPALPRSLRKMRQARRDVAAEAARIMATESVHNFRAAKHKASARVGVSSRLALPSNREIEDALRAYQGFFGGAAHDSLLNTLREAAVRVMQALERFSPRLVGPVLHGTADRYSRISLHVFADPPEAIALELKERGLPFVQEERRIRWHDGTYRQIPLLVTEIDDMEVELALFHAVDLRQAPPSPVDGQPQQRAGLAEVECLLAGA